VNSLQLVPSHSESDYTLGNPAQSLYLGNFGKGKSNEQYSGGYGDNKFSTFNFDPNMFQLEDWNSAAANSQNTKILSQAQERLNKQNYPDENRDINLPSNNLAKRKSVPRGEDEDLETTKKMLKNNPEDHNKLLTFGNFNSSGSLDIKEEGNNKRNVEAGRASYR